MASFELGGRGRLGEHAWLGVRTSGGGLNYQRTTPTVKKPPLNTHSTTTITTTTTTTTNKQPMTNSYFLAPKPQLVAELEDDAKAGQAQLAELARQAERASKAVEDLRREVEEVARDSPGAMAAFQRMMGGGPGVGAPA